MPPDGLFCIILHSKHFPDGFFCILLHSLHSWHYSPSALVFL